MAWTCPECGRVLSDVEEQALRDVLALDALVNEDADDPQFCGSCRWRYEPPRVP
jgi:uncharacterized protein with PIN domain